MRFIDIILQNSQAKEAKLFGPSKKASDSPETGIVIQNPSAYHVIKDCATLANKYIPHYVYGLYANPFEALKNKFTRSDVEEFVHSAASDLVLHQLLVLILDKVKAVTSSPVVPQPVPLGAPLSNSNDPYGEYEYTNTQTVQPVKSIDTIGILCEAFGVTK
jgi:hypothetical protein